MIAVDYLIIGGGIAGVAAAEELRKRASSATIAILEREPHPLYSRVQIPNYLKNLISREKIFLRTVTDYENQLIDYFSPAHVVSFDAPRHEVYAILGASGKEQVFSYGKLLITSGGKPRLLPSEIIISPESIAFRMQTLADADAIKEAVAKTEIRSAAVIGDGFIALEFIETFRVRKLVVHAICQGNSFGGKRFGEAGGKIIEENLTRRGVILHHGAIKVEASASRIILNTGEAFNADLIGIGIGISRNIELFEGVEKKSGIMVDAFLQSSDSDVYAAGDVAEWYHPFFKQYMLIGNWAHAFLQGKTAARNMTGAHTPFETITLYHIVNFGFSLTLIGNINENSDTWEIMRDRPESPFFARFFMKDGCVEGAALINAFSHSGQIANLITLKASRNELENAI